MAVRKLILASNFYGHYFSQNHFSEVIIIADGDIHGIVSEVLQRLPLYRNEPVYVLFVVGVVDLCTRSSSSKGKGILGLHPFDRHKLQEQLISVKLDLDRFNATPIWLTTFPVDLAAYHKDQNWDINNIPGFSRGLVVEQRQLAENFTDFMEICKVENSANRVPSHFFTDGLYTRRGVLISGSLHADGINPKDNVIDEWNHHLTVLVHKLQTSSSYSWASNEQPRLQRPLPSSSSQPKTTKRGAQNIEHRPHRQSTDAGLFTVAPTRSQRDVFPVTPGDRPKFISPTTPSAKFGSPRERNFHSHESSNRHVNYGSGSGNSLPRAAASAGYQLQDNTPRRGRSRGAPLPNRNVMNRLNNPLGNFNGPLTDPKAQRKRKMTEDKNSGFPDQQNSLSNKRRRTNVAQKNKERTTSKRINNPGKPNTTAYKNKPAVATQAHPPTSQRANLRGEMAPKQKQKFKNPFNLKTLRNGREHAFMMESDSLRAKMPSCKSNQPNFFVPSGVMPARTPYANKGKNHVLVNKDVTKEPYIPMIGCSGNAQATTNKDLVRMKAAFTKKLPDRVMSVAKLPKKFTNAYGYLPIREERTVYIERDPSAPPLLTFLSMYGAPATRDCKVPLSDLECMVGHYNNCMYELLNWQQVLKRKILQDASTPQGIRIKYPGGYVAQTNAENAMSQVQGDYSVFTIHARKVELEHEEDKNPQAQGEAQMQSDHESLNVAAVLDDSQTLPEEDYVSGAENGLDPSTLKDPLNPGRIDSPTEPASPAQNQFCSLSQDSPGTPPTPRDGSIHGDASLNDPLNALVEQREETTEDTGVRETLHLLTNDDAIVGGKGQEKAEPDNQLEINQNQIGDNTDIQNDVQITESSSGNTKLVAASEEPPSDHGIAEDRSEPTSEKSEVISDPNPSAQLESSDTVFSEPDTFKVPKTRDSPL